MNKTASEGISMARATQAALLLMTASAFVVTNRASAEVPNGPAADTTQSAASQAASAAQIPEIIVTAQRRAERSQDVPISVTALTGSYMENSGITGTSALAEVVPSLQMPHNSNGATPFLRGIGSSIGEPNGEGSVAVYVDGVYQPATNSNIFDFDSVERVEVLKGPQGTLFGRNATGGVVQVLTKDPTQQLDATGSVGYANYQTVTGSGYLSGGITDGLAANVAMLYKDRQEGWGYNFTHDDRNPGQHDFAIRGKVVFDPTESTSIKLAADYSHSLDGIAVFQPPPGAKNAVGQGYPGEYNTWSNVNQRSILTMRGTSLTVDQDFGPAQLVSISAYRLNDSLFSVDLDESALPLVAPTLYTRNQMYSQELHVLSRAADPFQWLAGVYFYDYTAGFVPLQVLGLGVDPTDPNGGIASTTVTHSVSTAVFGQGTYPIADKTNLTLGTRYTWDEIRYHGSTVLAGTDTIVDPINGEIAHNEYAYHKPTWRASLDHKFAPDVLGYISDNRGIKAGNFSTGGPPTQANGLTPENPYKPEQLDAYEIGLKSEWFDRRLRINTDAFYYDFKNVQLQKVLAGTVSIFNGPTATSWGPEIEVEVRATADLTLTMNATNLNTHIGNFPGAPNTERDPLTGLDNGGDPDFNAIGNRLPFSPKFGGSVGFNYDYPTAVGKFALNGNLHYQTTEFTEVDNRLRNDPYKILNSSLGWTDLSGSFSVYLWGKNLTGAYYYEQYNGQAGGTDIASPNEPRSYGITFRYKN
jgi:iron complex outermembrane recepter protein